MGLYNESAALAMLMLLPASLAHKATRPGCTESTNVTVTPKSGTRPETTHRNPALWLASREPSWRPELHS